MLAMSSSADCFTSLKDLINRTTLLEVILKETEVSDADFLFSK